jgi:hypothetical protein
MPTVVRHAREAWRQLRVTARIPVGDGPTVVLRGHHLGRVELLGEDDGSWFLRVVHEEGEARLEGTDALRAAGAVLPRLNAAGASASQLRDAIELLESSAEAERCFAAAAQRMPSTREVHFGERLTDHRSTYGALERLPPAMRLALEMAAHEDGERRALEGELAHLERAWREAEEVAAIADDLLLPPVIEAGLARLRGAS